MSTSIYPLRLTDDERRQLGRAAKSAGLSLAAFLRETALARAQSQTARPAILDYPDDVELSAEAEQNPKAFIQRKLKGKRELYS